MLTSADVDIRTEPLGGSGGGLCVMKGRKIFFRDTDAQDAEQIALCAQAVAKTVDIEQVYIKPQIRELIKNYSE